MRRKPSLLAIFLLTYIIAVLFCPCSNLTIRAQTGDTWWDNDWSYRKHHIIVGSTDGEQTNYPVQIIIYRTMGIDNDNTVHVGLQCQPNFFDIRFTTTGQSPVVLDYWIEEEISDFQATIWVEIPTIPASPGTTSIFMYYGNALAPEVSSGDDTFIFFDDFEDDTIDTTKWAEHNMDVGASFSETGGNLIVTDISVENDNWNLLQGLMAQSGGTDWNPPDNSFKITLESVHWDSADPDSNNPLARWGVSLTGSKDLSIFALGNLSLFMGDAWAARAGSIHSSEDNGENEYNSAFISHEDTYDFFLYKDDDNTVDTYYGDNIALNNVEQTGALDYLVIQYTGDETQNYQELSIETVIVQKWTDPEPSHGAWNSEGDPGNILLLFGGIALIIIIALIATGLWLRRRTVKVKSSKAGGEKLEAPPRRGAPIASVVSDLSQEEPSEFVVPPEIGSKEAALKQQAQQEEKRVMQWMREAMTSFEEGRYRHAAVDAWTVVEALLNIAYEQYLGEPKPKISYHKVIQKLIPHLPGGRLTGWSLQHARRLRNKIHPDSPEPSPADVERIIVVAQQMCLWLGLPLSKLVPPSVHILKEAQSEPCLVCSLELRVGQRVITVPCCETVVHYEHLIEWVRTKGYCPKCRALLSYRSGQIRIT